MVQYSGGDYILGLRGDQAHMTKRSLTVCANTCGGDQPS